MGGFFCIRFTLKSYAMEPQEQISSIKDLIQKRRSIFPVQYNGQPVSKEVLQDVLECANWAPNHKKTEPWRFKVIRGSRLRALGEFLSSKYQEVTEQPKQVKTRKLLENPQKAGVIIAICMQRDPKESLPLWEEQAAVAMAVQNMWLRCTELEIGAYWSSPGLIKYMGEFFELKAGESCLGFFYMGYSDEPWPESQRGPIADKVQWLE